MGQGLILRPMDYEGGGLSYNPTSSNRYERDNKEIKMLLDSVRF